MVSVMMLPTSLLVPLVAPFFALKSACVNLFSLSASYCASKRRVVFGCTFVPAAAASYLDYFITDLIVKISVDFLLVVALAVLSRSSAMLGLLALWL